MSNTPTAAKSRTQPGPSSAALSVASDGSGASANSGKNSLNHPQAFQSDESPKKHRDVGEVVAGLFSRKKRGRKGAEEHSHEDRGESRDGAGSDASSLLDAYGDEHGYVLNSLNFPNLGIRISLACFSFVSFDSLCTVCLVGGVYVFSHN